jgi:hypothetical protein
VKRDFSVEKDVMVAKLMEGMTEDRLKSVENINLIA